MANTTIKDLIMKLDPDCNKPQYTYEFSNGRRFYSNDMPSATDQYDDAILDGDDNPILDGNGDWLTW